MQVKRYDAAIISTVIAHTFAWAAALFLAAWPTYQGESVAAVSPGGVPSEPVRFTATFIEVNGVSALLLILAPVLLTALAALAAMLMPVERRWRGALVMTSAVLLLGFCAAGIASVGMFFLPATIALFYSAVMGLRKSGDSYRPT